MNESIHSAKSNAALLQELLDLKQEHNALKTVYQKEISERKKTEEKLNHLARIYTILSNSNQAILRIKDKQALFDEICRIVVELGKFRMAWIGLVDETIHKVVPAASYGFVDNYLGTLNIDLKDEKLSGGPAGLTIKSGEHHIVTDIANHPFMEPWRENAILMNYNSCASFPIIVSEKTIGVFTLYSDDSNFFDLDEVKLLDELALDISFGMEFYETQKARALTEKNLLASEEKFRLVTETIDDVFWINTPDLQKMLYISPAYEKLWQLPVSNLYDSPYDFTSIIHPDDMELMMETASNEVANGIAFEFDYRILPADGSLHWIHEKAYPIFDDAGNVRLMTGICTDITAQKLAEEKITQQNEKLKTIINAIPDILSIVHKDGTYKEIISTNSELLIIPKDLALNKKPEEIFENEFARHQVGMITKCLDENKLTIDEFSFIKDGHTNYYEARLVPFETDQVLVSVRNITDQKLNEEKIRLQHEKMNAIIGAIPDTMIITDHQGTILDFIITNPNLKNYPTAELMGKTLDELFDQELSTLHTQKINLCIQQNNLVDYEFSVAVENLPNYFDVRLVPLGTDKILVVLRNITDRKVKEEEIRLQSEKINAIIKAIPDILAIVGKDGTYQEVFSSNSEILILPTEQIVGKRPIEIFDPEIADQRMIKINECLQQQKLVVDHFSLNLNGRTLFCEARLVPLGSDRVLRVIRDVSAQKKAELEIIELNANLEIKIQQRTAELEATNANLVNEIAIRRQVEKALKLSNFELEKFFNVSLDLLCIADLSGHFVRVNKLWEDLLGFPSAELEKMKFIDFVHPEDLHSTLVAIDQLKEHEVIGFTNRYRKHDGTFRYMEWHSVSIGNLIYAAARDITERKLAENLEYELLQLTPQLTGISFHEIDSAIYYSLSRIGQLLSVDRIFMSELDNEKETLDMKIRWIKKGIPDLNDLKNIPFETSPEMMERLHRNEFIHIPSVVDMPHRLERFRTLLLKNQVKSLLVVPMLHDNKLIGFVGIDTVTEKKKYNEHEINILKVWANIMVSLIAHKQTEERIEQTRLDYESFFNSIEDFLWVINMEGKIVHTNKTVEDRLGYSRDELINQSILVVHPENRHDEVEHCVVDIMTGNNTICMVPFQTKFGKQIQVETKINHGFWKRQPIIFGVSKDIAQIQLSEQKFSLAFHSNSAMMSITNFENGKLMDVNQTFCDKTGYSMDELIGKTSTELNLIDARKNILEELIENNTIRKQEILWRRKDGSIRTGLFSSDKIVIGDEKYILSVIIDITEQKKNEESLRIARLEAERANLAKSEFLSRMSHELRTPMNSILGFGQLLEMGELKPSQKKGVNHILNNGKHLLDLINEVLDISGIEAGRQLLFKESIQLIVIIQEMLDVVQPAAQKMNQTLELIDSPANLLYVFADNRRLKQVLINLINNAIKYNRESGSVRIKTEVQPTDRLGIGWIRISVMDTGIGISSENQSKLFQPFERLGAEQTETEGTGLGLTVVKKLIDAMGGRIGVESLVGTGSIFWIELPLDENQNPHHKKTSNTEKLELLKNNKAATVLYIEDNISNVELVEEILETQRPAIKLISSRNGKQTLSLATEHAPDLILLDLNLPDMKGNEVLEILLNDAQTKSIPVVIVSADATPEQANKLKNAGAKAYLAKPLIIENFLNVMDEWIERYKNS